MAKLNVSSSQALEMADTFALMGHVADIFMQYKAQSDQQKFQEMALRMDMIKERGIQRRHEQQISATERQARMGRAHEMKMMEARQAFQTGERLAGQEWQAGQNAAQRALTERGQLLNQLQFAIQETRLGTQLGLDTTTATLDSLRPELEPSRLNALSVFFKQDAHGKYDFKDGRLKKLAKNALGEGYVGQFAKPFLNALTASSVGRKQGQALDFKNDVLPFLPVDVQEKIITNMGEYTDFGQELEDFWGEFDGGSYGAEYGVLQNQVWGAENRLAYFQEQVAHHAPIIQKVTAAAASGDPNKFLDLASKAIPMMQSWTPQSPAAQKVVTWQIPDGSDPITPTSMHSKVSDEQADAERLYREQKIIAGQNPDDLAKVEAEHAARMEKIKEKSDRFHATDASNKSMAVEKVSRWGLSYLDKRRKGEHMPDAAVPFGGWDKENILGGFTPDQFQDVVTTAFPGIQQGDEFHSWVWDVYDQGQENIAAAEEQKTRRRVDPHVGPGPMGGRQRMMP